MKAQSNIQPSTDWFLNGNHYSAKTLAHIKRKTTEKGVMRELSTFRTFKEFFPDDNAILAAIFNSRLSRTQNKGCPTCGAPIEFFYKRMKDKQAFRCGRCFQKIFPKAGTPLDRSHVELTIIWETLYHLMSSKHGFAAAEVFRVNNLRPETSWNTLHRIRDWIRLWHNQQSFLPNEAIEIDEVYILVDYIKKREDKLKRGPGSQRRHPVITMTGRTSGITKTYPTFEVSTQVLLEAMEWAGITKSHEIKTDEHRIYEKLRKLGYNHASCNHKKKEWVTEGETHTNTLEGFHAIAKGATQRTYKGITRTYIEKYMDEISFMFSNRRVTTIEAFNGLLNALPPLF